MYEDEDLQEIHEDIIELNEDISTLRRDLDNISASVEGSGENVTLNGTTEARFKKPPLPMGNSEQESTTGKNLWINEIEDGETSNGITVTKNADGSLTFNGTATNLTHFYFVKNNSTGKYLELNQPYTLSGTKNINTALSNACIIGGVGNSTTNDVSTVTLGSTREITKNNSFIRFSRDTVLSNYTIKPFIEIGTTQGEYEPYTNGASPNPDYPQEIGNVGDNINLQNIEDVEETTKNGITYSITDGILKLNGTATNGTTINLASNIFLKKGTYTHSINSIKAGLYFSYDNSSATMLRIVSGKKVDSITFKLNEDTTFNRYFLWVDSGVVFNNEEYKLKLEKGDRATSYSKFGQGAANVVVRNKNLFDGELELGTYNNTGEKASVNDAYRNANIIKVEPNTTYTFSINGVSQKYVLYFYDISKNFISWNSSLGTGTFITPNNAYYINFRCFGIDFTSDYVNLKIQLEKGSTSTNYVEHKEQVFNFPLANGQKLMLGDYLADDGIHHVRGQYIMTGQEIDWFEYTQSGEYSDNLKCYFGLYIELNNGLRKMSSSICSHFYNSGKWVIVPSLAKFGAYQDNPNTNNRYFITNIPTINDWKNWLQTQYQNGTPVVLEYELAEEIIVPYTSIQQEIYNQIKQAISYEEQTNIIGASAEANPIFEVKAFRNMNTSIESLQSRIELLKGRS